MTGFRLTLPARTTWIDLVRDLVAAGIARTDLPIDRFSEVLMATERLAGDYLQSEGDGAVIISMQADDDAVEVEFEAERSGTSKLTLLALERFADRSWQNERDTGIATGFAVRR